jgi:hypothetical protein
MRKKRSILLDKGNFNLMMERMDMRHTFLESEELKKSHLITEVVGGKGRIAKLLNGISDTDIDAMFKRIRLEPKIVENVKKGLNYLEDPIGNAKSFEGLSEEAFFEGIESIMNELSIEGVDVVKINIGDVFELQRIVEMDGNPFINLLKDDNIGMDGIRKKLKNVMDDYPDFFTNKLGDEGKLLEGESIKNFLYRQSLKDGLINPEIPKFRRREIQSELMSRNVGENKELGEIDVKDGDDIITDAEGTIIKVPKYPKFKSFMAGLYKWSGTKWYVRRFTKRALPTFEGKGFKFTEGTVYKFADIAYRVVRMPVVPFPPALIGWLGNCLAKRFTMDPPDIDVMSDGEKKKYEYSLKDCFGFLDLAFVQVGADGKPVNKMGFPLWDILPITHMVRHSGAPEWVSDSMASTFRTYFLMAMEAVDDGLDVYWENIEDETLPFIINTKCDDKLTKTLTENFKEEINGYKENFNSNGVIISSYNWLQSKIMGVEAPKLGEEDTEEILKIFGSLEGVKEFQKGLYNELSPYIPEGPEKAEMKKNGPTLKEIVKYKCESKRVELIIKKINSLNRNISFGDGETKTPGTCKFGDWCDNLKFWEQLATKTGDGVWSPEQCTQNTEEIRTIYKYVTTSENFNGATVEGTLLDPKTWVKNCAALANAHKDDGANNTIRSWICAADADETLEENLGEVTAEVTIIAGKKYIDIPYKWLDKFNLNNYSNSKLQNCNILKAAVGSFDDNYMLKNSEGEERNYRIKEGDGVTQNDFGQRSYDVKNKNVQDMMSEVWCTTKNLKSDQYEGLTVENCSKKLKEFMDDLDC